MEPSSPDELARASVALSAATAALTKYLERRDAIENRRRTAVIAMVTFSMSLALSCAATIAIQLRFHPALQTPPFEKGLFRFLCG